MEYSYLAIIVLVIVFVLLGIKLLSSPKTAVIGNRIGTCAMLSALVFVLFQQNAITLPHIIAAIVIGSIIGILIAMKVSMVEMPQLVALLNGFGGFASLLVAFVMVQQSDEQVSMGVLVTAQLAIAVGGLTFSGSMIAAGKLHKKISQLPIVFRGQSALSAMLVGLMIAIVIVSALCIPLGALEASVALIVLSMVFGIVITLRIGGADMPVTISLLNSLSGVAASICGFALADILLIAIGAIVGSAGLILTRIMCTAMNRSLSDIIFGKTSVMRKENDEALKETSLETINKPVGNDLFMHIANIVSNAKRAIIVPGYGMAVAQAQYKVKELYEILQNLGIEVIFAIHPVAGRMPGHMNVLLAEVDIPYEKLCELETVNPEFSSTDVAFVIGACDVVNPMAITAEKTPIYGMPILHVHEARHVIVCNLDEKPGYSGVENPLYKKENVIMALGDASDILEKIIVMLKEKHFEKNV